MKITFAEDGWSEYGKTGLYSRRIDEANRLVYEISDGQIIVKSCKGHYSD
ncbi:MAG: type II toxin-antitoxin system YoeB family toxin [Muribaculaceae bacterium]|nr:type II toxin-antitoxin system YoeB family toxin [Roseburia sp.]MCM1430025.1 type II toxin-antitoxin system YoeB family toxin [Muribaculaceae bacterium]MCM1492948.1 type II toxin-antitoxin system YoeB family toxin [Muribaculaceae bacterium]